MAQKEASSSAGVELIIQGLKAAVTFLSQIPDKGPHEAQILKDAINAIPQLENKLQEYINARVSGVK